jgi:hypothetical protein
MSESLTPGCNLNRHSFIIYLRLAECNANIIND